MTVIPDAVADVHMYEIVFFPFRSNGDGIGEITILADVGEDVLSEQRL